MRRHENRWRRRTHALGVVALSGWIASGADAQPPEPGAPGSEPTASWDPEEAVDAPPPRLEPPRLDVGVPPPWPSDATVTGAPVRVVLGLVIGTEGRITEAVILEGAGAPFDEAALTAVRDYRFRPAKQGGVPIAARVRFEVVIDPPPPPPTETDPPTGDFGADPLGPDGRGGDDASPAEPTTSDQDTGDPLPTDQVDTVGFEATAEAESPPREPTRREVGPEELTRVAGTRGDALRTIELLPGVARPPVGAGVIIVRGSSPQDTQVFLDGVQIPLLYHFGGLTSFMNSRLLERIELYPGNFSVRYGRGVGAIVEVSAREPAFDRFHAVADLNVVDASVLVEAPLGDRVSFAAAARRSYADLFFEAVVPGDAFGVVAAPVYWDYQTFLSWRPTDDDRVTARVYGSSDELRLLFDEPADGDPGFRGNLGVRTQFHRFDTSWFHRFTPYIDQRSTVSLGLTQVAFQVGQNADFDNDLFEIQARSEWRFRFDERVQLRAGVDVEVTPFDIRFRGAAPGQSEGDPNGGPGGATPASAQEDVDIAANVLYLRPAAYLELDLQPTRRLRLIPGVRIDGFFGNGPGGIDAWTIDPRLAAVYRLTDAVQLKAGVGLFTQAPEANESSRALGNPNLDPMRALHTSVGADWDITDRVQVGLEGFYKRLWDRVVQVPGGLPPTFINDGVGDIYGLEVSGRVAPKGEGLFGFLSYTLSRSERQDRNDPVRLFDFDQTHVLNVAGGYRLPDGWEVSGTFRLASGNPTTPITRGIYDARTDLYLPVFGPQGSRRDDLFHRLDLRVEKQWEFDAWKLAVYLDVQNAYNRLNAEGVSYNFDFTESTTVTGLPILPSIGVRGEL